MKHFSPYTKNSPPYTLSLLPYDLCTCKPHSQKIIIKKSICNEMMQTLAIYSTAIHRLTLKYDLQKEERGTRSFIEII